jgi:catechol 2,3-dioxygenase-like lactoylglutathione lyase family enzyme
MYQRLRGADRTLHLGRQEIKMRTLVVFIAGALVGLAANSLAQSRGPNQGGVIGLNHVGISVTDMDKTIEFYTKTMGFPETFRLNDPTGKPQVVYLQAGRNTWVELLAAATTQLPPGVHHFALQVENMAAAKETFKARGANVDAGTNVISTKAIMSGMNDPNGVRIELFEYPPESTEAQAIERWK